MGNREVALALAAAGYFVFPCQAHGSEAKKPVRGVYWRKVSTTDARQIERWWSFTPDALPAIDLAKVGLIAIDCDRPKKVGDPDGVNWYRDHWYRDHPLSEAPEPRTVTGSGGWHVFFRNPAGLGNGRGSLPPKIQCGVDVRGDGGYVIAPGAQFPDGRLYVPHGSPLSAPDLPDWLAAILTKTDAPAPLPAAAPLHAAAPPAAALPAPARGSGRLAAYTQAAVDAELLTLRSEPSGGRNNQLNKAAFALGTMVGAGWLSEGEAAGMLEVAAHDNGLVKDDGIRSVRATIRSGLGDGKLKPRSDLPPEHEHVGTVSARALIERDGSYFDPETGEEVKAAKPVASTVPQVPGLVGMIADWITATARRPQPALSLGAALAVVGTAIGRSLAGPTRSATHLYVIALAPTGAGKDHPLQQCDQLLRAAGLSQHVGPSDFTALPAVINFLKRAPLSLCAMDEFGAFLRRVNSRKAGSWEGAVLKILRTAWGTSFRTMTTPEYAHVASEQIVAPALSIFGATTPQEFYGSLEGMDRDNGVLNRFLLVSSLARTAERDPAHDPLAVPAPIVDGIKRLYNRDGVLAASQRNAHQLDAIVAELPWGADEAHTLYQAFGEEIEARGDADPEAQPFLARTVEIAVRVATIIAAGRFASAVDYDDMALGRTIALQSAEFMIRGARDHMADSETEAASNKIIRTIKSAGGRCSHSTLLRSMRHVRSRDLKDMIGALVDAELIFLSTEKSGGRERTSYFLR